MIKCIWYLKSLKQLLSILLISCFTFWVGCFTSATAYIYQNNTESVNQKTAWYTLNVFWKWNLLSKSGGYSKSMLFSSNYYYFFRTESWLPYIHDYTHYWLAKWYYLCNGLRSSSCLSFPCSISDINFNGCSNNSVWEDSASIIGSFMSSISSDDTYLLDERSWELFVCFDNTSLNSNICFHSAYVQHTDVSDYGSQFSSINSNLMANSPWYNWGWNWGSQWGGFDINTSNTYVSSCNKQRAINWYEANGFSSKLCYGGLNNFDIRDGQPIWTLPVYWQGLDIEEIWFNTAGYRQGGTTWDGLGYSAWFGYWRQLFETYKRGGYSVNPFINTPLVLFTYFGAVDTYWGTVADSKDILEYCELKLYTSDLTVDYTWVNKNYVCASALDILSGSMHNIVDGSWNILKWYKIVWDRRLWTNGSWNSQGSGWIGAWTTWDNYSWNNIVVSDGKSFLSEIFWKLDNMDFNNLDKSDFWLWVLPSYIILFFLAIVVFRFISH